MKCAKCNSYRLRAKNTHQAGPRGKTQRLVCERCGAVHTSVTLIHCVDPVRGQGAAALARQIIDKKKPAP